MSAPLRMLVIGASTSPICGVRDYSHVTGAALAECGVQVRHVWWQRNSESSLPQTLRDAWRWLAEVRSATESFAPDWVVWHYSPFAYGLRGLAMLQPLVARRLARIGPPVLCILHELAYPFGRRRLRGLAWAITQRLALITVVRASTSVLVTTDQRNQWLSSRRWLPGRPSLSLPVCSNVPPYTSSARSPADGLRIGVFGFGDEGMAPDLVIEALRHLHRRGTQVELRLIGSPGPDGPQGAFWRSSAARAGLARAVTFSGIVPPTELARELEKSDAVVFPLLGGPTSRSTRLAAALAAGKPVVTLDGGDRWEALIRERAVVVSSPNADSLGKALERLLADSGLRADQGRRAVKFYERMQAPERIADELLAFLRRIPQAGQDATPKQRPRIAIVAHDIHDTGGMERAAAELIRRGQDDFDFVAFSSRVSPELRPFVEWKRVPVPARPMPLKFSTFFLLGGLRLFRHSCDLVHTIGAIVPERSDLATVQLCHAGFYAVAGRLAPRETPLLRRVNASLARRLALAAERWCFPRARMLAAVSTGVARELEVHYPTTARVLTPNGVDLQRYRPDAVARRRLRAEEGADDDVVVFLFVGGDWYRKGLQIAMEAVSLVASSVEAPVRLWVVGRGHERRFRRLARHLGIERNVRFFGPRSETEQFFQAADVFVLPTLYETFSIAAHEAAAAGLPVVATRVSGVDSLVGSNEAGVLVERNPDDLAAALRALVNDAARRRRLGDEARRRVRSVDWSHAVESVLSTYRQLLSDSSTTAKASVDDRSAHRL